MLLPEDAYGRAKRQGFVEAVIRAVNPRAVLDFGCGTGTQLTRPLAQAFPHVSFLGIDSDAVTIEWARKQPPLPNLVYATEDAGGVEPYDVIIASEVLEHVEAPNLLLHDFHSRLANEGRLVVTVPNGHGPFETMSLVEHVLTLSGVLPVLRRMKHSIFGKPNFDSTEALTLAISPHINFFRRRDKLELAARCRFRSGRSFARGR